MHTVGGGRGTLSTPTKDFKNLVIKMELKMKIEDPVDFLTTPSNPLKKSLKATLHLCSYNIFNYKISIGFHCKHECPNICNSLELICSSVFARLIPIFDNLKF